jgi:ATP-dependent 26S proteasome regulatory subunit
LSNDVPDRGIALSDQSKANRAATSPGGSSGRVASPASAERDELQLLINSRTPIIIVETAEEDRLEDLLRTVAERLTLPLFTWTVTAGLERLGGAPIYNSGAPEQVLANIAEIRGDAVFLLKDFARYCDNDRISRRLRDLADQFRVSRRSIVLSGPSIPLPAELRNDSVAFELPLPTSNELLPCVNRVLADMGRSMRVTLDVPEVEQIAHDLVGFTREQAMRTLRKCVLARGKADTSIVEAIVEAKREALRTDGLLEFLNADCSFAEIAGLKRLRDWCEQRHSAFTPEGQRFGLVPPKGVLITGVQGCGKSLAARSIAAEWGIDLVRLDPGGFYDKYVGESEKRIHKTLDLAQKLSPTVLWIDEIEKAFAAGGGSSEADAGLSQRLLGILLTWMQDRESGVFLAATSNNITVLPPEMVRKGRFDEIFFVDLPQADVRAALFALHLKKRQRDPANFDLERLAALSEGFSGAEIEQAIVSGLYAAFNSKQRLSTQILLVEIRSTQPLSVIRAEEVRAIREWARSRARLAD